MYVFVRVCVCICGEDGLQACCEILIFIAFWWLCRMTNSFRFAWGFPNFCTEKTNKTKQNRKDNSMEKETKQNISLLFFGKLSRIQMVTYKVPSVTSQIHKDKKHGLLRNCISQEFPTNQNQNTFIILFQISPKSYMYSKKCSRYV